LKGKVAVVQVDVFDRVPWGVAQADEYWQASRLAGENAIDFALRSRREAVDWIDQFPRQEVLYVIEFSPQDDTAEGIRIQRRV
jgi:hypothetical protein